jgi:hypothetical protein
MTKQFALELENGNPRAGYVHKTGCRDLRDPEPLGNASTANELSTLVADINGLGLRRFRTLPIHSAMRPKDAHMNLAITLALIVIGWTVTVAAVRTYDHIKHGRKLLP